MRLIDADAVLAALGIFHRHDNDNNNARHFMNGIETAVEIIEDAPDVKAVPLKPLAEWLAGYAAAPGAVGKMCYDDVRADLEANEHMWEDFLRGIVWRADDDRPRESKRE